MSVLTVTDQKRFLVDAAIELFTTKGYAATELPMIGARAEELAREHVRVLEAEAADGDSEAESRPTQDPGDGDRPTQGDGELEWCDECGDERPPLVRWCELLPAKELILFLYMENCYADVSAQVLREFVQGPDPCDDAAVEHAGDWRERACCSATKGLMEEFFLRLLKCMCPNRFFVSAALQQIMLEMPLFMENWELHRQSFWSLSMRDEEKNGLLGFLEGQGQIASLADHSDEVREWVWTYWLLVLMRWFTDRSSGTQLTHDFVTMSVGTMSGYISAGMYVEIDNMDALVSRQGPARWLRQAKVVNLPWPLDRIADDIDEEVTGMLGRFGRLKGGRPDNALIQARKAWQAASPKPAKKVASPASGSGDE